MYLEVQTEFGAHIALEMIERRVFIAANAPNRFAKSTKDHQLAKTALNQTFDCESLKNRCWKRFVSFSFRFFVFVLFQIKSCSVYYDQLFSFF